MATALELTNKAIDESGLTLEQLTSSTYAAPSDSMQLRMKNWVNDAWKELQMERQWDWTNVQNVRSNGEQGTSYGIVVGTANMTDRTLPFLALNPNVAAGNLLSGNWVRGRSSGAQARLLANVLVDVNATIWIQGTLPEQNYQYRLYIANGTGVFQFGEEIAAYDSTNTTSLTARAGRVADLNAYRLTTFRQLGTAVGSFTEFSNSTDGFIIDTDSFVVTSKPVQPAASISGGELDPLNSVGTLTSGEQITSAPLAYLDWDDFERFLPRDSRTALGSDSALGTPKYISKDKSGMWRVFPTFDYRQGASFYDLSWDMKIQTLGFPPLTDGAVPLPLPTHYHDMIAWRALMYYANFDNKPNIWKYARGRWNFYKSRLEENHIEQPKWRSSPYYPAIGGGIR